MLLLGRESLPEGATSLREISSLENSLSYRFLSNDDHGDDEDDDDSCSVSSMCVYLPAGAFRFITAQCASRTVQRPDFCVWSCVALEDRPDVARLTKRFGTAAKERKRDRAREIWREGKREREGEGARDKSRATYEKFEAANRLRGILKRANYIVSYRAKNFDITLLIWRGRHNSSYMIKIKIIVNTEKNISTTR